MSRNLPMWVGSTDDTTVPPRVKIRVFERCRGRCHRCGRQIPVGDLWVLEHLIAIINGGANAEGNLGLTCSWCKPKKDAEDVAIKANTYAKRKAHILPREPSRMQSRGFAKVSPQHSATTPPTKVFRRTYAHEQEEQDI